MTRVDRLRELLEEPLLVTSSTNVFWLTGFKSSNAALLVEPGRLRLFSDFRYADAARTLDGVEFTLTKRSLLGSLAELLDGRIGFEQEEVSYAGWDTLRGGGLDLVPRSGLVEGLRAVKGDDEIETIRRAATIADDAYRALLEEPWLGRTDRDLAWRLEELMHERGSEGPSFQTIVAPGPQGALPHGRPNGSVVAAGTLVVVDWGATVDGYSSDCTRTVATGELPDDLARAYDVCLAAQQTAVAGLRAGLTGIEADALARGPIGEAGFSENFGHGTGHGVGLLVHEAPRLSTESADTLVPGNVVTIEPGIYLAGRGGVRIEDLAVVTESGVDILTPVPKDLVTVG